MIEDYVSFEVAKKHISYRTHLGYDMFELGLAERISENTNPYDD